MTMDLPQKPILCLDFDGVCHSYTSGWKGATVIPDPPVAGMWEFIRQANEEFEVHIISSRSHQEGGERAMRDWFLKWATDGWQQGTYAMLIFSKEKPPALVTLDDRAITFRGVWPSIAELKEFKPWNAKEV